MPKDEPVKDLLGNINRALIQRLLECKYSGDKSAIPTIDYLAVQSKALPKTPPLVSLWRAQNMNHSSLKCHHVLKLPYGGSVKYT